MANKYRPEATKEKVMMKVIWIVFLLINHANAKNPVQSFQFMIDDSKVEKVEILVTYKAKSIFCSEFSDAWPIPLRKTFTYNAELNPIEKNLYEIQVPSKNDKSACKNNIDSITVLIDADHEPGDRKGFISISDYSSNDSPDIIPANRDFSSEMAQYHIECALEPRDRCFLMTSQGPDYGISNVANLYFDRKEFPITTPKIRLEITQ